MRLKVKAGAELNRLSTFRGTNHWPALGRNALMNKQMRNVGTVRYASFLVSEAVVVVASAKGSNNPSTLNVCMQTAQGGTMHQLPSSSGNLDSRSRQEYFL